MSNKYPRIGSTRCENISKKSKRPRAECCSCGEKVVSGQQLFIVQVQTSWFRGEDDVLKGHRACASGGVQGKLKSEYGLDL